MECSDNVLSVVVLPPDAGGNDNLVSDEEELQEDPKIAHEPADLLVVEKEVEDDAEETTHQRHEQRWKKTSEFDSTMPSTVITPSEDLLHLDNISPFKVWHHFFTEDMIEYIARNTNLYANRDCNNRKFVVSAIEVRMFLGILLLSGYHTLPQTSNYWSTQPDLGVPAVYNVMTKNRFIEIKRYLQITNIYRLEKN